MQDPNRPVTGYPVPNPNGCAPNYPPTAAATAATAYPYQNPNPYPYSYTGYTQQQPAFQNPRPTLARRVLIFLIALCITIGAILIIIWLVLRPQYPDFTIQSLSLSNFNSSSDNLNATWDAQFQIYNPNKKMSVAYEGMESAIKYGGDPLTQSRIPPFSQGTRNSTTVDVTFAVVNSYVGANVVNRINNDRSGGQVKFTVNIASWMDFRYGGWRFRRRLLEVSCRDVPLSGSSGKMLSGAKKCSVF